MDGGGMARPAQGRRPEMNERNVTIAANISLLAAMLAEAHKTASEAASAADKGQMNIAIGTLLDIERTLPEAIAVMKVAFALHRMR